MRSKQKTPKRLPYKVLMLFLRCYYPLFYRQFQVIDVDGNGTFPIGQSTKSTLKNRFCLVNHPNSLIDALSVCRATTEEVRLVAMHLLWKYPFLRPFLYLGGVVPVYRRADLVKEGTRASKKRGIQKKIRDNSDSSDQIVKVVQKYPICIFGEGTTHLSPQVKSVKSGVLRFLRQARDFQRQHPSSRKESTDLSVQIVALYYERRLRFRSNVLVVFGPCLPSGQLLDDLDKNSQKEQQTLQMLQKSIQDLLPNAQNTQQKHQIRVLAKLLGDGGQQPIAELWQLERKLTEGASASKFTQSSIASQLECYSVLMKKLKVSFEDLIFLKNWTQQTSQPTRFIKTCVHLTAVTFLSFLLVPFLICSYLSSCISHLVAPDPVERGTYLFLGYIVLTQFLLWSSFVSALCLKGALYAALSCAVLLLLYCAYALSYDYMLRWASYIRLMLFQTNRKNFQLFCDLDTTIREDIRNLVP